MLRRHRQKSTYHCLFSIVQFQGVELLHFITADFDAYVCIYVCTCGVCSRFLLDHWCDITENCHECLCRFTQADIYRLIDKIKFSQKRIKVLSLFYIAMCPCIYLKDSIEVTCVFIDFGFMSLFRIHICIVWYNSSNNVLHTPTLCDCDVTMDFENIAVYPLTGVLRP